MGSGLPILGNLTVGLGGDKRDRTAVVCLPERLSRFYKKEKRRPYGRCGGDKRDRTADLLNAISGKGMESVGIWWNLAEFSVI